MKKLLMLPLCLVSIINSSHAFTIKSPVDPDIIISLKTRSALNFEKTLSLRVGVDPRKINSKRRSQILSTLIIKDGYGNVVPAVDYDTYSDISIGFSGGDVEILRVITTGKYPKIIVSIRDQQGRLIKPDIKRLGASTLNGKPVCLDIQPIGQSQISIMVDLIIDRSGSMAPVMEETKQAARELVKQLPITAQCQIKAAGSTTENLTPNGFVNCQTAITSIDQLYAFGGTDLYSPLYNSYQYFSTGLSRPANEVDKTVIIITDGWINQSMDLLYQLKALKGETRTLIYYIGNSNDQYFSELSDAFVKGANQAHGEITNFLSAVGKSIEYQHVLTQKACSDNHSSIGTP